MNKLLLIFDRNAKTLTVLMANTLGARILGEFRAANNTASTSRGPWPPGIYKAERLVKLPPGDDDPNGPYGAWFIRFIVQDRDGIPDGTDLDGDGNPADRNDGAGVGMGLHAGRRDGKDLAGRSGFERATNGCVRTTDEAMELVAAHFKITDGCWIIVLP